MEKALAAQVRRTKINSAIISTVAVAGLLPIAVLAPNVLGALGKTKFLTQRRKRMQKSFTRLVQAGYILLEGDSTAKRARLTKKGEWFAARIGEGSLVPKKPRRWDGKWRMLIFDIPETRKKSRAQLRCTLAGLGFRRLQDSVWVYPYDCEDFVTILKLDMRVGKDILYIIADRIENDKPLRIHFGLE